MNSLDSLSCVRSCLACHLRSENFFSSLPRESLEGFNQIKHPVAYPAHAVIFLEGHNPRGIFMLCQGQARLSTLSRTGKTLVLRIAEAGEVLGLHSTITARPYELTAETMQPCWVTFVSRADFLSFLKKHGDACLHSAKHVSRDYQGASEVIRSVGLTHSMSERLAKFLLALSLEGLISSGVVRTKFALTHEEISQLIGSSRESITRQLSEFRRREIVELKDSTLIIHNKAALEQLVAA